MNREIINQPLLVLVGPTAIGKTSLSLTLADRYGCEIVSVDSMQVYRYMDIGTAKVTAEERRGISHHLIDIVDPSENYDAACFTTDALKAIRDIHSRGKLPLLTGGTGLYLRSLLYGIFPGAPADEQVRQELHRRLATEGFSKLYEELITIDRISAERINYNDSHRLLRALEIFYISGIPWSEHLEEQRKASPKTVFTNLIKIGLTCDREQLYARINMRCQNMIDNGLEEEVRKLLAMGYNRSMKSLGSIGYRHMINYLEGGWSFEEMMRLLARDTRRYAKRQYTWFTKMVDLQWFQINEPARIVQFVDQWMVKKQQ
ncbi:MAG: tRNA (adenosine(37)-N6)-dimethylallyltransferase MiaA [Proteobacteria bacterium]|nr:tRNA (adenosine(37)-N6)-dimethylallyltransferase MiaA [Pseudomonadota bacterium]